MSALLLFKLLRNRNISSNLGSRGLSLLWSLCLHSMGLFRDCETSRKFVSTSTHSPSPLDTALILSPCLTSQPRHYFMWTLRNSTHYDVIYRFIVTQRINKLELHCTTIEVWTTSLASYYCICIVVVVLAAAWLMAAGRLSHYTARKRNSIVFVPVTRVIGPPTQNKTIQLSLRTLGASKTLWWRSPTFWLTSSNYRVWKQQQTREKRQRKQAFYPLYFPSPAPDQPPVAALHHLNKSKKCRLTQ